MQTKPINILATASTTHQTFPFAMKRGYRKIHVNYGMTPHTRPLSLTCQEILFGVNYLMIDSDHPFGFSLYFPLVN